jgi:hypothetical protein
MSSSGWPARYPIFQPPNAPVLVAQGLRVVAAVSDGPVRSAALAGSRAALAWWAYGELTDGANVVRRAIGAVALGFVARSLTSGSRSQ